MSISRAKEKVSFEEARRRLRAFEAKWPGELWPASMLANVIWPDNAFLSAQGSGRAAAGVLKRLGLKSEWTKTTRRWSLATL